MKELEWIVVGTKGAEVILTSKGNTEGILPKGSYLTIDKQEKTQTKFILRVVDSSQNELYSPSPLIVEMELKSLSSDTLCKNTVIAIRVSDTSSRTDGLVDVIKPTLIARRSNQDEINEALGNKDGPKIFPATVFGSSNTKLIDNKGNFIYSGIPIDIYWHQIQITGKTGSGKTVASKYLAQHFIENKIQIHDSNESRYGAVLAINVKDKDFLTMNKETSVINYDISAEWESLNIKAGRVENFEVCYHATESQNISGYNLAAEITQEIALDVTTLDPKSLFAIVQNLNENQQQYLPDIFRWWLNKNKNRKDIYFDDFLKHFEEKIDSEDKFPVLNESGRDSTTDLHAQTASAIFRKINSASKYFKTRGDDVKSLQASDILKEGKLTVLHVTSDPDFGAIILRDMLNKIMDAKNRGNNIPITIIIDEVHQFYKSSNSRQALGDLDTICRVGRSKQIGVIFSTQNEDDLPKGITSVVNTKLYFKNDTLKNSSSYGVTKREVQSLKAGYGVGLIHGMPELNVFKFPMSKSGVQ